MHRRTASQLIALTALFAFAMAFASPGEARAADDLLVLRPGAESSRPEIDLLASDDDGAQFVFELPALDIERTEFEGESFQTVHFSQSDLQGDVGAPALPCFTRYVQIPARAGATLEVVARETERLSGYRILPMQDVDQGTNFALDAALYARDEFLGEPSVEIGAPSILRDLRIVPVTIRPVRYNPARGEIEVLRRVELRVAFDGYDTRNVKERAATPLTPGFDRFYRAMVLNYGGELAGLRGPGEVAEYLGTWVAICRDNPTIVAHVQDLAAWRKRMGFKTYIATTSETGSSASSIRSWLMNAYNSWDDPPTHVALIGDAGGTYGIPTFYESQSGYNGEGDHPYSMLDGTDNVPEVFVGRLSFDSLTTLELIVTKILSYETDPYTTNPNWFTQACLVGDPSSSGYTCIQIQQWLKEQLLDVHNFTYVDTIFSGNFANYIRNMVNTGVSFFGYRGYYGMSGWDTGDIYNLSNDRKLPFCLNLTCGTGSFASGTSINEAWLRAGTLSPLQLEGGIGSVATATLGTHTRYNNCFYAGMAYGFFWDELYRLGEAQARAKIEMILNYGQAEPSAATIWCYWNTLMGDPATELWTGVPEPLQVDYADVVPLGANVVTVTVRDAGSNPVENAWVYVRKGSSYGMGGYTQADGTIDLPLAIGSPGTVELTVTGHNLYPHQGSFDVEQLADFVGYAYHLVDDDASYPSNGNGDGLVNPGETIRPRMFLTNYGSDPATNVSLTMSCDDPYVGLALPGPVQFSDLAPGETSPMSGHLAFNVYRGTPDGHAFTLDLTIESDRGTYHSLAEFVVSAGALVYQSHSLNGCGTRLDPGESCTLTLTLANNGAAAATGPIAGQLISDSYAVDVTDNTGTFAGTISPGGTGTNSGDTYGLAAPSDAIPGSMANLRIALEFADGVRDTVPFVLEVGAANSDDPTGPDNHGYYAYDNTDTAYPEAPAYSWVDIAQSQYLVGLSDYGEDQDDVLVFDLPFPFQFYGEEFTRVSICSNGWIAMGATYLTNYRNWYMPGACGPRYMIAPFWDNCYQTSSGKIYHKYEASNHRYIISYDRIYMRDDWSWWGTSYLESFQVILYDPQYYPTYSGDGVIVFQYEIVNNNDDTQHYCTAGIQNRDHTDGLTYSFFNIEPPTAPELQAGRAIKFTTGGPGASHAHSEEMAPAQLFWVRQNQPNPCRATTTIRFGLERDMPVALRIFDVDGHVVRTLAQESYAPGEHVIAWHGKDNRGNPVPAGVYFYKLDAGDQSATRKMLLLR